MYNGRLPEKVENDYRSLGGRITSCKLYSRLSLQPCVSQCTCGTPPTAGVSTHSMQGTEPYIGLAPRVLVASAFRGPEHEDQEALGTQDLES